MRNLQRAFSPGTIYVCRFEIIDGVKYVYCIKHALIQISFRGTTSLTVASMCFLYIHVFVLGIKVYSGFVVTCACYIMVFCNLWYIPFGYIKVKRIYNSTEVIDKFELKFKL